MIGRATLAVSLCWLCATAPVLAEEAAVLQLDSYGVYCKAEGPSTRLPAPGTVLGYVHITRTDTEATVVTTRVPATLGIAFGVALRAPADQPDFNAEFRITHPTATPGERITERWVSHFSPQGPVLNQFRFEFPEELNTGLWVMEVYHADARIFRQAFEVVAPEAAGDILAQCSGFAPLS